MKTKRTETTLDEEISRFAKDAYEKFRTEPLVIACGGVDRASYCSGFDEGFRAALRESHERS